jgi:hypothetical protein
LLTEPEEHLERAKDAPFKILTPDFIGRLPDIPQVWHPFGPFAFLRLLLPDILTNYRRILYLDCDVRIAGDYSSLFDIDMGRAPIAAAIDPLGDRFNSGVSLIDCENWKREGSQNVRLSTCDTRKSHTIRTRSTRSAAILCYSRRAGISRALYRNGRRSRSRVHSQFRQAMGHRESAATRTKAVHGRYRKDSVS